MKRYYLAVDLGASSGRHILGTLKGGKIKLEEIYRFENRLATKNGHLCWDFGQLFREILSGMKRCKELGKIPISIGIDTWAVDFVLLDENDKILGDTVAYRDSRTDGMEEAVFERIPAPELYRKTGIQIQKFNTIYQLYSIKSTDPELLARAKRFLMAPEYFNFLLTGRKENEYTNSTTTQLVNAETKTWDPEILRALGLNSGLFGEIRMPKFSVGRLVPAVINEIGYDCEVVLPATHDTGSAVLSAPATDDDFIYLSSGTWSLIGIERPKPDCGEESFRHNFTNEGGYERRFRYLKNIMGLWMIQSVRRELGDGVGFGDIAAMAEASSGFESLIDVNDGRFLSPSSMSDAIRSYCKETGKKIPATNGELVACIYNSLAKSYADAIDELEEISGRTYRRLHILGGGSQDDYLNRLTAKCTGKEVYAGPVEATSIGNLTAQMLKNDEFADLYEARAAIARSMDIRRI